MKFLKYDLSDQMPPGFFCFDKWVKAHIDPRMWAKVTENAFEEVGIIFGWRISFIIRCWNIALYNSNANGIIAKSKHKN